MAPKHPSEGITVSEAARRAGVSRSAIQSWMDKGYLPHSRFGPEQRIIRIDPTDLAAVLGRRKESA